MKIYTFILAIGLACISALSGANEGPCKNKSYSLQLLGSGGPISDDGRSSSASLIWWKNKPLFMIDAGGGSFLRFGQSGAKLENVRFIGLTHFHTDHVSDLPALLKGSYFFNAPHNIDIAGPTASEAFPSLTHFMNAQFAKNGAYAYLSGIFDGKGDIPLKVKLTDVDYHQTTATKVYEDGDITISALGIPHGNVPTLAYRIDTPEGRIVISADQNGSNQHFIDFAKNADILVMPLAIDEGADSSSAFLHAKPSTVGKIAAAVQAKNLVLNHFMGKSLRTKDQSIAIIKKYYKGPVYAGRDLSSISVN